VSKTCPECGGDGKVVRGCHNCDSTGWVNGEVCPVCDGDPERLETCANCNGTGKVEEE
jgi:DnaJ-class molecular chaperone